MNLLEKAGAIFNKGFDPEKDPVSDFETIPDGTYTGYIEGFEYKIFSTGTEAFQFKIKITEAPYENRIYFGALFLNENSVDTSIKRLLKYAHKLGIELTYDDFADTSIIEQKMQDALAYECTLKLKTSKGRNGNEFTNFTLDF